MQGKVLIALICSSMALLVSSSPIPFDRPIQADSVEDVAARIPVIVAAGTESAALSSEPATEFISTPEEKRGCMGHGFRACY